MNEKLTKATKLCERCAESIGLNIVSVDYVFESGIKILRVIASGDSGLSLDEASQLNQIISDELDKVDIFDEEYYLEVSSEGIEKELRTDADIQSSVGKYIYFKLYEKINGVKEVYGDLVSFENGVLEVNYLAKNIKKNIKVEKTKISKIRLAVKF